MPSFHHRDLLAAVEAQGDGHWVVVVVVHCEEPVCEHHSVVVSVVSHCGELDGWLRFVQDGLGLAVSVAQ